MFAGMFVTHQGVPCQVTSISHIPAPHSGGRGLVTYMLLPVGGGDARIVRDPMADDVPLCPACPDCGAPAGFAPCVAVGVCSDPLGSRVPRVVESPARVVPPCGCGACPECYSARQGQRVLSR